MRAGIAGLLRDKTRPSRIPPLPASVRDRTVALTLAELPGEATHWTAAMMAQAVGISVSSVQRIWCGHGLQPHRVRQFKLSRDPRVVPKLRDIVGLCVDPPAHAIVLSVDEKSQIQALDRTQPGLPLKPGRCGTMTHDYKRHGHAVRYSLQTFPLVVERPESAQPRHRRTDHRITAYPPKAEVQKFELRQYPTSPCVDMSSRSARREGQQHD